VTSEVFNDMSQVAKAGAAYAKAQATFNAAAKQCGLIMKPLHDAVQDADQQLKLALNKAAEDEAKTIKVDLAALLQTALDEQIAAAAVAAAAAQQQGVPEGANGPAANE
jgi:hypothetical protein